MNRKVLKSVVIVFASFFVGCVTQPRSTANSKDTIKWEDGKEYPLIKLEISHIKIGRLRTKR